MKAYPCPWISGVPPDGKTPTRVIICGTRTFNKFNLLERVMDKFTFWFPVIEVVLGSEGERYEKDGEWFWRGADYHGKIWAEKNWHTRVFERADWKRYGKSAGPRRNLKMAELVSPLGYCVCFWDGKSPGTKNMIEMFLRHNAKTRLRIVSYV